ncbi:50S ribosomal protein L30 [Candidatus Woesearchaeota archaeon CG10_big_fil_rev_8_21_14_0_10_45_16]|nr:MAG: 50S ribosomal protein L30 [Candidatus Woesearchaeota archaeon CG10_big_fil_rev_8_21_14_0_10_45_16]
MAEKKTTAAPASSGRIAIVLVRGMVGLTQEIKDTLQMLRLGHKNYCAVVADTPVNRGMIQKVKDYVTYGPISDATFTELVAKRGEEFKARLTDSKKKYSYKVLEVAGKKYKPYFRLNPPRKGFGRKGIKMAFKVGGGLGFRGDKMDDLIMRML